MQKRYDWMQSYLRILMTFLMLLIVMVGYSRQASQISGIVVSADDNEPLPGVSILVKGTSRGTVTNMEGEFSVQAAPGDVLTVSFIGFETQELTVSGGRPNYENCLESSMGDVGEVGVVGDGSQ